ncbi:hypothetical protein LTR91_023515 [Friedmanniomyces endolithicus]|uniref:AB hydrolase-1 domain-containing protein n=1 Tax=Friedmanniomyces endolithicus TaxID=329885 RepID=A0AAN6H246_9PEZI|nr:hypothetical protein LTR91_023515 [Friedmanniomyces endolithicus]KAK0954688.1 hypothetical protein LTS01_023787 [Friedmanniomyces endolithicus]KAK1034442.1 hypothetical protein LTS16_015393 [Friedmanniomyces endolithicus]
MAKKTTPSELHKALTTNPSSHFEHFSIKLDNGAILTGIHHFPAGRSSPPTGKPLLVGHHGATCSSHTFDTSPEDTAAIYSQMLGVPFVAFNRPNYIDSSGWLVDRSSSEPETPRFKAKEGTSFFEEEARWLHDYILPALWTEFGIPNGCTSLVTLSHSMAVPIIIIAISSYSAQAPRDRKFKWAGAILYGYAEVHTKHSSSAIGRDMSDPHREPNEIPPGQDARIHIPPMKPDTMADLMCGPEGVVPDNKVRGLVKHAIQPFLTAEVTEMGAWWPQHASKYKAGVEIPILYALGEYDWVWQGSKRNVDAFCKGFVNAPRIEGAVVAGAPHAIHLGRTGGGWWVRCFGFAIEVAESMVFGEEESKPANFEQGEWPAEAVSA